MSIGSRTAHPSGHEDVGVASYALEDCPFETVIVDVTHKCNMACANCYTPDRSAPDPDREWLLEAFRRLPPRRYLRLVGAEPTMRQDLLQVIRDVKDCGHHPVLMTNGLRLANLEYVRELKRAGVQVTYLSMNGAFDDGLYEAIDHLRCADRKSRAFAYLRDEHMYTSVGMIVVPGLNAHAVGTLVEACLQARNVRELHLRSVGAVGRFMTGPAPNVEGLLQIFADAVGEPPTGIICEARTATSVDFKYRGLRVQLTQWPDLANPFRGRLTPDGRVAAFFEHLLANDGGWQ